MAHRPLRVGDRVFLNEDARLWMHDVGVRPGEVVNVSAAAAYVAWWGIEGTMLINSRNLEVNGD